MENKKHKFDSDWMDVMDSFLNYDKFEKEFEDFWLEVEMYATEHNITTDYCESEFLIDGEFHPVSVEYMHDLEHPEDYPERNGY